MQCNSDKTGTVWRYRTQREETLQEFKFKGHPKGWGV